MADFRLNKNDWFCKVKYMSIPPSSQWPIFFALEAFFPLPCLTLALNCSPKDAFGEIQESGLSVKI